MYTYVRLGIVIITIGLLFLFLRKKQKINKTVIIILIVSAILLDTVLHMLPFENIFMTFSTAEDIVNYFGYGDYYDFVDGKESCMIMYVSSTGNAKMFAPKTKEGYKLPDQSYSSVEKRISINGGGVISLYKVKDTNDYYFVISGFNKNDIDKVVLSSGKEIELYKEKVYEQTLIYAYSYIENYGPSTYVIVGEQKINL